MLRERLAREADQVTERIGMTAATEVRAIAHVRVLGDLFARRPDLAGVYPPADLAAEAVRWSA